MRVKGKRRSKYFWIDNKLVRMSPMERIRFYSLLHFETDISPFIVKNLLLRCKQGTKREWINLGFATIDNTDIKHFITFIFNSHGKFKKSSFIDIVYPTGSRTSMKNTQSGRSIPTLLPRRPQHGARSMRRASVHRNGSGTSNS